MNGVKRYVNNDNKSHNIYPGIYWSLIAVVAFFTCFLYLSLLQIAPSEIAVPYTDNAVTSITVTVGAIITATGLKANILKRGNRTLNMRTTPASA